MELTFVFAPIVATLLRTGAGWLENALEDGKIEWPEWRKLLETLFRISIPYLSLWLGFNVAEYEAAFISLIFDVIFVKLSKLRISTKAIS